MRHCAFVSFWRNVALATIVMTVGATVARAGGQPILRVNGGGTGLFIDPSVTPTDMGLTTNFSVGLSAYADGTAVGHFTCVVPRIVVVDGYYDSASYDSGTGLVTASGTGILYFPTFDPIPVCFTNTFIEGGPGVGVFTLSETSGFFPNYPNDVDSEVVIKGTIAVR